jgi:hypothetical protein
MGSKGHVNEQFHGNGLLNGKLYDGDFSRQHGKRRGGRQHAAIRSDPYLGKS